MKTLGLHRFHIAATLTSVLALAGCGGPEGPELGQVTGTVTLDGKPAGAGYVVHFVPHTAEGAHDRNTRSSAATTDDSGKYELKLEGSDQDGAIVGKHGVVIINAQEKGLHAAYTSGDVKSARAFWANVESGSQVINIPLETSPAPGQVTLEKK